MFNWELPKPKHRNGNIIAYTVMFSKNVVLNNDYKFERNTSQRRMVFNELEENMDYLFQVRFKAV